MENIRPHNHISSEGFLSRKKGMEHWMDTHTHTHTHTHTEMYIYALKHIHLVLRKYLSIAIEINKTKQL